jgi:pyruvate/2-oxoglutarate dehydrogenase complex dihydrolipoamide dehydrogenase (E3) component
MNHFDFTVLGGGSAGYAAARTAAALGMKTAVIDGADELGGLCILRGCMPSKTLIESANRALTLQRASEFGLAATVGTPDITAIRDRKRHLIADFAGYRQGQLQDGRFTLHRAQASFQDAHTLAVTPINGDPAFSLSSAFICIATGSVPNLPPIPGLAETGYWTSDDILDTDTLPKSCIILGGGAIALEMAHYLNALGTQVTLIQRSGQLLNGLDPDASSTLLKAYRARGMDCYCDTQIQQIQLTADGQKEVHFTTPEGAHRVAAQQILVSLGRSPNTASLNLTNAGIATKGQKIIAHPTQQTSQPHLFAAGDVASPLDVVHLAIQQGEIAARNAHRLHTQSAEPLEQMDYRLQLFGVFSHPQVAAVGASEADLHSAGTPFISASYPFDDHGKSMTMGETEGFVKMLAHAHTGEILGALCVGPEATELIHEVVVAMNFRATAAQFLAIPHYHPTLSEIWTYPAEDLADQVTSQAKP